MVWGEISLYVDEFLLFIQATCGNFFSGDSMKAVMGSYISEETEAQSRQFRGLLHGLHWGGT